MQIVCQRCESPFMVTATVAWHTKLCPVCRVDRKREQERESGRKRHRYVCSGCNRVFYSSRKGIKKCRPCHLQHIKAMPRLSGHKYMGRYGYIWASAPEHQSKYGRKRSFIQEHRLVMEQALNRPLEPTEIVHHINGVKHDNRIQNLINTDRSNHERDTFVKVLQKRIRELEAQLSQQKLL